MRVWAVAGVAGAALGPAIGGLLTQLISWQSIFVAAGAARADSRAGRLRPRRARRRGARRAAAHRGQRRARAALGGPRRGALPARAAARRGLAHAADLGRARRHRDARRRARSRGRSSGAWPARARARPPARCSGVGRRRRARPAARARAGPGRSRRSCSSAPGSRSRSGALTEAALAGRSPAAIHGGYTIAARHAGVVLGLVLLTPVFVADLDRQRDRATQKGAELVLDARIDALTEDRPRLAHRERHQPPARAAARHQPLVRRRRRERSRAAAAAEARAAAERSARPRRDLVVRALVPVRRRCSRDSR